VGYAKARGIPFFLTFQKKQADTSKGQATGAVNKVHFDLAPYRYIEYETTHELRDKLKQQLDSWHEQV
jgi:hypothetical protein